MKFRSLFFTIIFSASVCATQAAEGVNAEVKNCAYLLAQGKKYQVAIEYDIDFTDKKPAVSGSFSVNWSPEYFPSVQEQEKAFKELEPFINCVGINIAGGEEKKQEKLK